MPLSLSLRKSTADTFRLPRSLSLPEMWSYGLVGGPVGWLGLISGIHLALGASAIWVWIPATVIGIVINCQIKRLASHAFDISGGTPNYIARMFQKFPILARYGAIGYLLNWVTAYVLGAFQMGDLLNSNLPMLQNIMPIWIGKVIFMILPLIVAFSGTRALSMLHIFVASISLITLLAFVSQGFHWLAFAPQSPGLWPKQWQPIGLTDWAKWFFLLTYATYSGETTATFLADSRQPKSSLKILDATSVLMAIVFIGASWIVSCMTPLGVKEDVFVVLGQAAQPFWGDYATLGVTIMIATSSILVQATGLSIASRVIYQLSQDGLMSPVFAVRSRRGVFAPALLLSFGFGCFLLWWSQQNLTQMVAAGNTAWFVAFMLFHWGLWRQRRGPYVLWPQLALIVLCVEVLALCIGGPAWGWANFGLGLILPFSFMLVDRGVDRLRWPVFQVEWWQQCYVNATPKKLHDVVTQQVWVLIGLMSAALLLGWLVRSLSIPAEFFNAQAYNALTVVGFAVIMLGIAIACLTSIPAAMAVSEAKQAADQLLENAQDGILVVN
jgi:hypothetical protein